MSFLGLRGLGAAPIGARRFRSSRSGTAACGRCEPESGDQAITIKDLSRDMNKAASVKFTPERCGDMAKSIQINR
jgi:hypothetical protein